MNEDSLTFKVLDKSSASPSILIIKKDTYPYIMKVWLKKDTSEEANSLRYEDDVYRNNIKPMLDEYPKLGLVNYFGSSESTTAEELAELLGIDSDFGRKIFYDSIYIFKRNPSRAFDYSDLDLINLSSKIPDMTKVELQFIVLPCIKFNTLRDVLKTASTERIIKYTKQLIEVIYHTYAYGVVHNDLHYENVMIDENDNALVFDWDRSYSKTNGDNPMLDKERCADDGSEMCFNSQCNILNDDNYAIDLYKILYYILHFRNMLGDATTILRDVFKIVHSNPDIEKNLQRSLIEKLTENPFFSDRNGCTYLQYPDDDMKFIHKLFGGIDKIYDKTLETSREEKSENVSSEFKFNTIENPLLDFNIVNKTNRKKEYNKKSDNIYSKKEYNVFSDLNMGKILKDIKNPNNISSRKNKKYLKSIKNKPARWFYEIIEENNIRKYGTGIKHSKNKN
jgi:serine/threonine protein kinase